MYGSHYLYTMENTKKNEGDVTEFDHKLNDGQTDEHEDGHKHKTVGEKMKEAGEKVKEKVKKIGESAKELVGLKQKEQETNEVSAK